MYLSVSGSSRSLQACMGVIGLVLSSLLIKSNQSIGGDVNNLNDVLELSSSSYNLSTPQSSNIVSMISSGLTLVNKGTLMASSKVQSIRSSNKVTFYKRTRVSSLTSKVINTSIPIGSLTHLASILGSETVENLMWFGSAVLGITKTGDWNCNDANSLIKAYNLTSNSMDSFDQFINDTLSKRVDEENDSHAIQSKLLLKLSDNCKLNKAGSGISIVNYFLYMLTSGLLVHSVFQFRKEYTALDGLVELTYENPFHFPKVKKKIISVKDIEEELIEEEHIKEHVKESAEG